MQNNPISCSYIAKSEGITVKYINPNQEKGGTRQRNQSPYIVNGFRRFDKVIYNGIECFITGKRSSGYFQLKKFDGTVISQGVNSKRLKLLEPIKGWLIDWKKIIPPQPKEVKASLP